MPTPVANICDKCRWNPSNISEEMRYERPVLMDNGRTPGDRKTMPSLSVVRRRHSSPQCSCATDFPSEIQRPYYKCAHQPSLVAGSRADPVQARCHGVQSATWKCIKLPRATCPRRRCVWSSSTPLRRHESHPCAASHVHHRRQSSLPVAASLIWNSLLDDVISAESLPTFQRKLKRPLFCQSFPGFCY